jgi:hypothetical protein
MPYMPGDTRMATCFKLVHRLLLLKHVLQADPAYHKAAQAAIRAYDSQAKPENKVQKLSNGSFPDAIAVDILDSSFWLTILFAGSKTSIYFLRMVYSNLPVLGKIFYTCALINKQLKYLAQSSALVKKMHSFRSLHYKMVQVTQNVHVLAYALDPSYQSHTLSHFEYQPCSTVLKRIRPDTWTQAVVELKEFKRNTELFDATVW